MSTARRLRPVLSSAPDPELAERRRLKREPKKRLLKQIALTPAERLLVQEYVLCGGDIEKAATHLRVSVSEVQTVLRRAPVSRWCEYYLELRALKSAQSMSQAALLTVECVDAELLKLLKDKKTPLVVKVSLLQIAYGRLRVPLKIQQSQPRRRPKIVPPTTEPGFYQKLWAKVQAKKQAEAASQSSQNSTTMEGANGQQQSRP